MRSLRVHAKVANATGEDSYVNVSHILVVSALCLSTLVILAAPIPSGKPANYPAWWFSRGVIVPSPTTNTSLPVWTNSYPASDDYAAINQGQLKNIATQAYNEFQAQLPSSTWSTAQGQALTDLVTVWDPNHGDAYAMVNLGQLKTVAKPFYDVLTEVGITNAYSNISAWEGVNADDYAVANIGQVKNLFSFDVSLAGPSNVTATNGASGATSLYWSLPTTNYTTSLLVEELGTNGAWSIIQTLSNTATSATVSGLNEGQNYNFQIVGVGTNSFSVPAGFGEAYHSSYYNGTSPSITSYSGTNQIVAASTFAANPLVARVTNAGTNMISAPVTFSLATGSDGGLSTSNGGTTSPSVSVTTSSSGLATVYYEAGADGVANNIITAAAGATGATTNFTAYCGQQSGLTAWFRADNGVTTSGGSVTQWNDQTTNGYTITQSGTNAPTPGTDPVTGRPVVQFNGYQSISSSSTLSSVTNVTLITVASTPTPNASEALVAVGTGNTSSNSSRALIYSSGNQSFVNSTTGTTSVSANNGGQASQSGALTINSVTYSGTLASFYSNGVANGTATVSSSVITSGLSLGSLTGTSNWNGNIAEVLIYNTALTTTQRQAVELYLANKYSIIPAFSTPVPVTGTNGTAFSYTVTASNGPTTYTARGLPAGLTMSSGGVISGTPTVTGTFNVAVSATNAFGTGTEVLTLTLYPAAVPTITSATVANAILNQPFNFQVRASNGPTSYAATGLPYHGLSINSTTGLITGPPTSTGSTTITLTATNASGTSSSFSLTLNIYSNLPTISGLTAWFNGDVGVMTTNGLVTQWNDQSTNGFNVSESTPSWEPTVATDPSSGHSTVAFNGSQLLTTGSQPVTGVNDVTIITVAGLLGQTAGQQHTQVVFGSLYGGSNSARIFLIDNGNVSFGNNTASGDGGPVPNTPPLSINSVTFSASSGTATFYSQGVGNGSITGISAATVSAGLTLGSLSYTPYLSWNGNLAEILIYNGVLTTAQRQSVEAYLANKYGLYVSGASWISSYSTAVQGEINSNHWNKSQADNYVALQANNPSMLTTGLLFWVKADSGVTQGIGNTVTSWADQTGNYPLTQTEGVVQPSLVTNDSYGEPAVRFGGSQTLTNPSSLGACTNMTLITVGMTTSPNMGQSSLYLGNGSTTGATRALGYNGVYTGSQEFFNTIGGSTNSAAGAPVPNADTFAAEGASLSFATSSTASVNFYRNGSQTATGSLSGLQAMSSGIAVGNLWQGDISEALVYDHQLNSTELNQVSLYLANKYGLYYPGASWITGSSYTTAVQSEINANQWNKAQADAAVLVSATLPVVSGLTAWFKADSTVVQDPDTSAVTAWKDSSWNHNDVFQTTTNAEPTVGTDQSTGTKTVNFTVNQYLANANNLTNTGSVTLVAVAASSTSSLQQCIVAVGDSGYVGTTFQGMGQDYGNQSFISESGGYLQWIDGGALSTNLTATAVSAVSGTGSLTFYSNGSGSGSGSAPNTFSTFGMSVGSLLDYSPYYGWSGNISEVLIYNRILSGSEITSLQTYFNGKYVPYTTAAPTIAATGTPPNTSRTVTLAGAMTPAVIRYTLDGSTPTISSTQYTGTFALTQDTVVSCSIFLNSGSSVQISPMATTEIYVGDTYSVGIPDSWFTLYGLMPPMSLAGLMTPGGLTYLQAYQWGYNPTLFSSNGDGLSDLVNYQLGYAGNNYDINNYGLSNAQQLALGLDPFDINFTPPPAAPSVSSSTNAPTIILTQPLNTH